MYKNESNGDEINDETRHSPDKLHDSPNKLLPNRIFKFCCVLKKLSVAYFYNLILAWLGGANVMWNEK